MNILVTGGAGFIGSHLCEELLNRNHFVICLDNFDDFYPKNIKEYNLKKIKDNKNFKICITDILDFDSLNRIFKNNQIDIVCHLAARPGVRPSIENPLLYFQNNLQGTITLLESMRINKVKKMIFASSSSVYGANSKIPFKENEVTEFPLSPYAASKIAGERICFTFNHLYNIDITCFRFFTAYGPRQRPDLAINLFSNKILSGDEIFIYGDGTSYRDYTFITDIVQGVISSFNFIKGFETFNLGNSKPININEVIDTLEKNLGKKAKRKYIPVFKGDMPFTLADISKARKMINYNPQINFENGIKLFTKWLLKNR